MVYAYLRYSTNKQDEAEEMAIINNYCKSHNLKIDNRVIDRAITGASSFKKRENLFELISGLQHGDTLICSEASRISRSMADFSVLLNDGFRRLGIKLIICKPLLEVDCSSIDPMTQLQLQMLSFMAEFERQMLKERIKGAMDDRREQIRLKGGFTSNSGRWCTNLGPQNEYISVMGGKASAKKKKEKSLKIDDSVIDTIIEMRESEMGYDQIANTLNNIGLKTASGRKFYPMTIKRLIEAYEEQCQEQQ